MRILITNDDGIHAEGLRALATVAQKFGDVMVVAPDRERSACGHAMTMREPLRVTEHEWEGLRALSVNGLPVDCVNVGLTLGGERDLVLSGMNHGPNLGFDISYSGTVGGAMEGTINGIRSIAISMASFTTESPAHFETGAAWLSTHLAGLIEAPLPALTFLNVNIPSIAHDELRGHRVVPMGKRIYKDRVEKRDDPWGRPYYWQGGVAILGGHEPDTDIETVKQGFVSVTPISMNWTQTGAMQDLSNFLGLMSA